MQDAVKLTVEVRELSLTASFNFHWEIIIVPDIIEMISKSTYYARICYKY